jgi:pyruvate formate lyase activating enzyme
MSEPMKEAMLYEKLEHQRVRCNLCGHRCVISAGRRGVCKVRENQAGSLYTLVYGQVISQNVDPVEKKPLYHFYPGSKAFSIATAGCNFSCQWCQNWQISQLPRERDLIRGRKIDPEKIVESALLTGSRSIAYTYTEPTIFFEYSYHIALLAHLAGLANIYVTNGYMTAEMLQLFHPHLDAANVDLKTFRKRTYHKYIGANLQTVLDSLKALKHMGVWVEVTTLVIPGINDDPSELRDIARYIVTDLGPDTPWHISRFFPTYRLMNLPSTPITTLRLAQEIGLGEGLRYVYVGNIIDDADTHCYQCGELLIRRQGYWIAGHYLQNGRCPSCGTSISGVWAEKSSEPKKDGNTRL